MADVRNRARHRLSPARPALTRPGLSLRFQLLLTVLGTTVLAALLFGFLTLLFAYSVEDSFFEQELERQGATLQDHWRETGRVGEADSEYIRVYSDPSRFPADLRRAFEDNPHHPEFKGSGGRRYQVHQVDLPGTDQSVWLGAEVSGRQVVPNLREKMVGFFAVTTLVIMLLVGAIGWRLADRLTAPLTRLARSVSLQAAHDVPTIVGSDYAGNEIGRLAIALQNAFQRIEAFVARERGFTRDISHELRTPLAVIRGGTELIHRQTDLPDSVTAPLGRIREAERQMSETVALLLTLAREEGPGANRERVPLAPLVETAVLAASDRFGGHDRAVMVDVPADTEVLVSRAGFLLILDNLISNAFQHAPDHALQIRLAGSDLMIADGGPGIPDEIAASAGRAFVKGPDSDGTGLGLSIVQRLCARDDIPLTLSASEQGTIASLSLRLSTASSSPDFKEPA